MDCKRALLATVMSVAPFLPSAAFSQSVAEAVRSGLDNSPTLAAARARVSGVMEQQVQAKNLRRPSVQLTGETTILQNAVRRQDGTYNLGQTEPGTVSISVSQPLMLGGRFQAATREADLRVARTVARLRSQELQEVRLIIQAYAGVRRDFEVAAIRAQGVSWLSQQLVGAQARQNEGLVGLTEVSQVQTRLSTARAASISAQARLQASWATLERLVGFQPTGLTEDKLNSVGIPGTLGEAIDLALATSNDLKASRLDEEVARAVARTAQAETGPRVNLQAGVTARSDIGYNGGRNYDAQIGARVVIPLWSSGQPQSRVRAALAESNAARLDSMAGERRIKELVTQAWASLQAAEESIVVAEELVGSAQSARTGAELEFDIGLRSIIEVLNQEQELQESKVNLENSKANLMIAQAGMSELIGLDPTGVISEATQFDPTKLDAPFTTLTPGKLAAWERPLVDTFETIDDLSISSLPSLRSVRKSIFGPEQ